MPTLSVKRFQQKILNYYRKNGRPFPWRRTKDPYRILVSEIMLQQTQTERVKKKYVSWLQRFPTLQSLSEAKLRDVLAEWQGLGYNRRALALKRATEAIMEKYDGRFPKTYEEILSLPGIGPYTAGAIMAFAFNKPFPIIETNIRTVFIHFFFGGHGQVHDKEILELVRETLPEKNPCEWYYALMDYGAMLKNTIGNLNTRSAHYAKQSKFKGSNREIRSAILQAVHKNKHTVKIIARDLEEHGITATTEQLEKNISSLITEGFLVQNGRAINIA